MLTCWSFITPMDFDTQGEISPNSGVHVRGLPPPPDAEGPQKGKVGCKALAWQAQTFEVALPSQGRGVQIRLRRLARVLK